MESEQVLEKYRGISGYISVGKWGHLGIKYDKKTATLNIGLGWVVIVVFLLLDIDRVFADVLDDLGKYQDMIKSQDSILVKSNQGKLIEIQMPTMTLEFGDGVIKKENGRWVCVSGNTVSALVDDGEGDGK